MTLAKIVAAVLVALYVIKTFGPRVKFLAPIAAKI
jgi:hypothetical protein